MLFRTMQKREDFTNINEDDKDADSAELIREVKDKASLKSSYVFKLSDDSDVEICVCTAKPDEVLLAHKTFSNKPWIIVSALDRIG